MSSTLPLANDPTRANSTKTKRPIATLPNNANPNLLALDWSRFRGPNGSGISPNESIPVYPSAVASGKHLLFQTRFDGLLVVSQTPELNVLSQNRFSKDASMFNATPAIDQGDLYLRSDSTLYCVDSPN